MQMIDAKIESEVIEDGKRDQKKMMKNFHWKHGWIYVKIKIMEPAVSLLVSSRLRRRMKLSNEKKPKICEGMLK